MRDATSPLGLAQLLPRRRFFLLAAVAALIAALVVGVRTLPPLYASTSAFRVLPESTGTTPPDLAGALAQREFLSRLAAELGSAGDTAAPAGAPARSAPAPERLRHKIRVRADRSGDYIVQVTDNDPSVALRLNQVLTRTLLQHPPDARQGGGPAGARPSVPSPDPALEPVVASDVEGILRGVRAQRGEVERARQRVDQQLRAALGSVPDDTGVWGDPTVAELRAGLLAVYTTEAVERLAGAQESESAAPSADGSTGALRVADHRIRLAARLEELLARSHAELADAPRGLLVRRLELSVMADVLAQFEARVAGGLLAQEVEFFGRGAPPPQPGPAGAQPSIVLLQPPRAPAGPVRSRLLAFALAACGVALGAGLLATLAAERLDARFRGSAQVQAVTGIEIVGALPRLSGAFPWRQRQRRQAVAGRIAFAGLLVAALALLAVQFQRAAVRDALRLPATPSGPLSAVQSGQP